MNRSSSGFRRYDLTATVGGIDDGEPVIKCRVVERARLCVATALYGFYGGLDSLAGDSVPKLRRLIIK